MISYKMNKTDLLNGLNEKLSVLSGYKLQLLDIPLANRDDHSPGVAKLIQQRTGNFRATGSDQYAVKGAWSAQPMVPSSILEMML